MPLCDDRKAAVAADPTLDFLKDAVEEAPNLPEPPAEPPARVARQRWAAPILRLPVARQWPPAQAVHVLIWQRSLRPNNCPRN